jgi:hypothetical protein
MIKVEVVKSEGTTELFFESRNDSQVFLDDLDAMYAALVGGTVTGSSFVSSTKFRVRYKNPEEPST